MALSYDERRRLAAGTAAQQGVPTATPAQTAPAAQQKYVAPTQQKTAAPGQAQQPQAAPAQVQAPGPYQYANSGQLETLYQQIVNRPDFSFDLASSPLWQSYKDQYTRLGQMAMQDTMGQAAGLTGGYGSSYGQAVGQQQYNRYLQELNGIVPELYAQERSAYDADTQRMMQLYGMENDRENQAYARYLDDYNRWWTQNQADQDRADAAARFEWQQQVDQRDYDFSREQWEWQKAQAEKARSSSGGGGGSYGGGGNTGNTPDTEPAKTGQPSGNGSSYDARNNEMTFVGGYSESDLGSIVKTYYDRYVAGKASGSLEDFLRSVGVTNTDAQQYAKQVFNYAVQTYGGPQPTNWRGGR